MIIHSRVHRPTALLAKILLFFTIVFLNGCQNRITNLANSEGDILFVSGRHPDNVAALVLLNSENKHWEFLENVALIDSAPPAWSPTGQAIAFEQVLIDDLLAPTDPNYGRRGIVILDSQGHRRVFGPCLLSPAWSSDGKWLAFHDACGTRMNLSIATIDGSAMRILVPALTHQIVGQGNTRQMRISWSPDDQYIVFDHQEMEMSYLWIINIENTVSYKLTRGCNPAWSPLDNRIAFERDDAIWIISLDDRVEYKFIDDPIRASWPTWSPNAQQLAFVSYRDNNSEIYRINLDGSGLENLTQHRSWDLYPTWRP